MINIHSIKQEDLLNQRLHEVIIESGKKNLNDMTIRNQVVYEIKEVFKKMGYSRNEDMTEYKLPLEQCKTCKIQRHCIKAKVPSCPNELGEGYRAMSKQHGEFSKLSEKAARELIPPNELGRAKKVE
jgi:hypothetical protein